MKKSKLYFTFGWFKGNPFSFINIAIWNVVDDYPVGWLYVSFIEIHILKFEISIGLSKC